MAIKIEAARLAVLGKPISHSKSPQIHSAAYAVLDLPWVYTSIECDTDELAALLNSSEPDWRGFSVTMPLKVEAHRLSLVRDPVAEESGVVNTLLRVIDGPNGPQWAGFNTDVAGLAAAISAETVDMSHTVVIGAGATATSAIMAARSLGAKSISVIARRREAAEALAQQFDQTTGPDCAVHVNGYDFSHDFAELGKITFVISTLPSSAGKGYKPPVELVQAPLFDVAYDQWPSPLAQQWEAAGSTARSGINMLVEQAVIQARIFVTGDPNTPLEKEAAVREHMRDAGVGR